jgi:hypothetical protein
MMALTPSITTQFIKGRCGNCSGLCLHLSGGGLNKHKFVRCLLPYLFSPDRRLDFGEKIGACALRKIDGQFNSLTYGNNVRLESCVKAFFPCHCVFLLLSEMEKARLE